MQPNHSQRLREINDAYRPDQHWGSILGLLETSGETFIVREKTEPIFDGQKTVNTESERKEYEFLVRNMFYWLGYSHGSQSSVYKSFWTQNSEALEKALLRMAHLQVKDAIKIMETNPK